MRRHLGAMVLVGALAAWAAIPASAQSKPSDNPAPCSVTPQPDPCGTTPAPANKPNAMQKFPFPGETSGSSPSPADSGTPNLSGAPPAADAPDVPAAPAAKKDFPFPGDTTKPDAGASPGSSSSSSSSSSGDDSPAVDANGDPVAPALKDKGTEGTPAQPGRHILHRVNPIGTKLQSADERESEDIDIAHYYVQTGDLKGAYLRGQDAVKTAPDDPEAHFVLAEIALKLNKKDEAIAEYNACLKLDPVEKEAKDARKALARLKP
jgi:TolA-binding protein